MVTRLITPPTTEPVTVAEAKDHLRLEHVLDDGYVSTLITAARAHVEEKLRRSIMAQTWELVLPAFSTDVIELPWGKLVSVTSVKYLDANAVEQTFSSSSYYVDTDTVNGRVILDSDLSWPETTTRWNAVVIRYVVGWPSPVEVPAPIKQAMLLLVSHMYENRSPEIVGTIVSPVNFAVDALLNPYRVMSN